MSGLSHTAEDETEVETQSKPKHRKSVVGDHGTSTVLKLSFQPSIAIARAFRTTGVPF